MMGCYLEFADDFGKVAELVKRGATVIPEPAALAPPDDQHLVVVVENVHFDAALLVWDGYDFRRVKYDDSGRPRTWLLVPKDVAKELAPRYEFYEKQQ